ncbi:MAG: universal stress protein [Paracoccaceae bacterium]
MFKKILFPVDLAHKDALERALHVVGKLAQDCGARVVYMGATSSVPGSIAHTPEEFGQKLEAFAAEQARQYGIEGEARTEVVGDPRVEADDTIVRAAAAAGADLIVMQTHQPGLMDYVWHSNGERVASHAPISVFLVR